MNDDTKEVFRMMYVVERKKEFYIITFLIELNCRILVYIHKTRRSFHILSLALTIIRIREKVG